MRPALVFGLLASLAAQPALAEPVRQLGKHRHGHGTLDIAIEANRVAIALEAPGADIVGFEHEPATPDQKAALEKAKATLADPLALFQPPAAAGCKLVKADVTLEADDDHKEKSTTPPDGAHTEQNHAEHDHTDVHAVYDLDCTAPDRLVTLTLAYFQAFPNAQALNVTLITSQAQKAFEVTRQKPVLDLSGLL